MPSCRTRNYVRLRLQQRQRLQVLIVPRILGALAAAAETV